MVFDRKSNIKTHNRYTYTAFKGIDSVLPPWHKMMLDLYSILTFDLRKLMDVISVYLLNSIGHI